MNCLIVDDNIMARAVVKNMLAQFDNFILVGECENPIQAINVMKKKSIDLIFLDVEMPKMTGLEFLKSLEKRPLIILITAKTDYAVEAFEYNVVDYLVTPFKEERFIKSLNRAQELFENAKNTVEIPDKEFIFIRDKGTFIKVKIAEINYIQALGDYITIYTTAKNLTIRYNLKTMEERLSPEQFIRTHRSYIIAINKVDSMNGNVALIAHQPIPIGDSYRSSFIKKLNLI